MRSGEVVEESVCDPLLDGANLAAAFYRRRSRPRRRDSARAVTRVGVRVVPYDGSMARIATVEVGDQDIRPHKTKVACYVQTVLIEGGPPLVHITTFGSADRESPPKSSQSMQFDRETASELIDYFVKAFGPSVVRSH